MAQPLPKEGPALRAVSQASLLSRDYFGLPRAPFAAFPACLRSHVCGLRADVWAAADGRLDRKPQRTGPGGQQQQWWWALANRQTILPVTATGVLVLGNGGQDVEVVREGLAGAAGV